MYKKISILILTFFLFNACSLEKKIAGKYRSEKNPNSAQFLNLNADSSFNYQYKFVDFYEKCTGKYSVKDKNVLVLNSDIHFTTIPLRVSQTKSKGNVNVVTVIVKIKNGEELSNYSCSFFINGQPYFFNKKSLEFSKQCDSITSIQINEPIHNIRLGIEKNSRWSTNLSNSLQIEIYNLKDETGNNLICTIDCDDRYFFYKAFNNDTCRVKHNKIGFFNGSNKKWHYLTKYKVSNY